MLGWALILALWLFFMGYFIFKGSMAQSPYGITNSINVNGEGRSMTAPDMLVINLSVSELADTTEQAQLQSNEKMDALMTALSGFDIPKKDIKTTSVNNYPEYDRSQASGRKLIGYKSQHSLTINVSGDGFWIKWGDIVDAVSKIGGVEVNGTYFDLKDKNAALAIARGEAVEDARKKAEQLAKASGGRLGKVLTIEDNSSYNTSRHSYDMKVMSAGGAMEEDMAVSSQALSPGETEIVVNVNVVYKIK